MKGCLVHDWCFETWWNSNQEDPRLRRERFAFEKSTCFTCIAEGSCRVHVRENHWEESKIRIEHTQFCRYDRLTEKEEILYFLQFGDTLPLKRKSDSECFYYQWLKPTGVKQFDFKEKIFLHPMFYIKGLGRGTYECQKWHHQMYTAKKYQGFLIFLALFPLFTDIKIIISKIIALLFIKQKYIYVEEESKNRNIFMRTEKHIIACNDKIMNYKLFSKYFAGLLDF